MTLPKQVRVRGDVVSGLRAARGHAKTDDFVEDEENIEFPRDSAQGGEKFRIGQGHASRCREGVDDDAGEFFGMMANEAFTSAGVVERQDEDIFSRCGDEASGRENRIGRVFRAKRGRDSRDVADEGRVVNAVVRTFKFGDFWTARKGAGHAQGIAHGLGARTAKAQVFEGGGRARASILPSRFRAWVGEKKAVPLPMRWHMASVTAGWA